jgi:hypothetical protein
MNHTTRAFPCSLIILTVLPLLWGCPSKGPVRPGVEPSTSVDPIFVEARNKVFLIGNDIAGPMGTAFLVTVQDKNYIITNFHVVGQIKDVTIETEDKVKYGGLQVLALDRRNDVAVLSAPSLPPDAKGFNVTHTFETSQKIFVIGFPNMRSKEEHLNFVTGVISDANYVAPPLMGTGQVKNIQITAPINAGNSGSPVLNERAEVVGVVSWRFGQQADIQGGNYAVPFQNATNLIMEIQSRTLPPPSLYPPGGACADDDECQWIYHCINGTCQTLADVGDACSVHDDCFLPYYCKGGVCTKIGALDDTCQDDSQCMPPNYCILGKCGPLRDKGEACAVDIDCVMPLYCIVGKCVASLSDAGGPCSQSIDCKSPLTCANGTCQQFQCTSDQQCYPLLRPGHRLQGGHEVPGRHVHRARDQPAGRPLPVGLRLPDALVLPGRHVQGRRPDSEEHGQGIGLHVRHAVPGAPLLHPEQVPDPALRGRPLQDRRGLPPALLLHLGRLHLQGTGAGRDLRHRPGLPDAPLLHPGPVPDHQVRGRPLRPDHGLPRTLPVQGGQVRDAAQDGDRDRRIVHDLENRTATEEAGRVLQEGRGVRAAPGLLQGRVHALTRTSSLSTSPVAATIAEKTRSGEER